MMHHTCRQKRTAVALLICIVLLLCSRVGMAETARIAIFPLVIHAAEDLEFMQSGIFEMLAGRLESVDTATTIIPRQVVLDQIASLPPATLFATIDMAQALRADYFVYGSLSAFGQQISTDVKFVDTAAGTALVTFSQTGTGHGDVIAHIDRFATLVNRKRMDQATGDAAQDSGAPDGQPAAEVEPRSLPGPPLKGEETAGPEISGLVVAQEDRAADGRWQSDTFNTHLKGVAVGDVDGDGANETVMIDRNRIYVYRFEKGHFSQLSEFQKSRNSLFLSVDVADINGNGKAEIFVTSYDTVSERSSVFVFESTANGIGLLSEKIDQFYRVFSNADGHQTLMAQEKVMNPTRSDTIQVLAFEKGQYVSIDTIAAPRGLSLYEMTVAPKTPERERIFIGYVRNHEIAALNSGGETLWDTGEAFGGSLNYLEYTDRQLKEVVRYYLPKRILVADTDRNGKQEMIAIRNINSLPGFMLKSRRYKRGYIACMEWDDKYALQPKWKTIEEHGYISDLAIADATNDGKPDLVFSVVSDVKTRIEKSSAYLVIQQLP